MHHTYQKQTPTVEPAGIFFMGWKPDPTGPIKLNSTFFTLCAILRLVVASAAEADLGALFPTTNRQQYVDSCSKKWGAHSPPHPYIAII
jgi:hypothetical protein